jgi:hypothetical protein
MGNLNSAITQVLLESNDIDVSGKYSLFALYKDNQAVLHLFEDKETFESMKHKFTSNDEIKRLGASKLPENTTFRKLSENIEDKFGVSKERFSVRTHQPMVREEQNSKKIKNVSPMPKKQTNEAIESVLRGKERFTTRQQQMGTPQPISEKQEPTINSFRPAVNQKIDLSRLSNGDTPLFG